MSTVLKFENVSKLYRLGEVGTGSLAQDLQRLWARMRGFPDPFEKVGQTNNREQPLMSKKDYQSNEDGSTLSKKLLNNDFVWALKDISFDVKQGDVVGILGRNGAGKSTLLKLLSRITSPTGGTIKTKGRIASLLEVGTGFHPDLTGRENIFLNGAILGMSRQQIKNRLDEIVDFSGCAKYIDTPVKRYSSGMTVRLGFAVAAHLECEVLVVDEVLAVGDTEFQAKCIGKMKDASTHAGKTVLFVSHNLGVMSQLCHTGILISNGRLSFHGSIHDAIEKYYEQSTAGRVSSVRAALNSSSTGKVRLLKAEILDINGQPCSIFNSDCSATISVDFEVNTPGTSYCIGVEVENALSGVVFCTSTLDKRPKEELGTFTRTGRFTASFRLPLPILREGTYYANVVATIPCVEVLDQINSQLCFFVNDNSSPITILGEGRRGHVIQVLDWQIRELHD